MAVLCNVGLLLLFFVCNNGVGYTVQNIEGVLILFWGQFILKSIHRQMCSLPSAGHSDKKEN